MEWRRGLARRVFSSAKEEGLGSYEQPHGTPRDGLLSGRVEVLPLAMRQAAPHGTPRCAYDGTTC